ncbi:MAG: acyltransferase [Caldilineaceae bacterium]|nr:acyltransferase [Caldilineaceae bacterium]
MSLPAEESTPVNRQARLTTIAAPDKRNSLVLWHRTVSVTKAVRNGFVIMLARHVPSLAFKRWLYRQIGMQIGRHVSFAWHVTPDLFFPELIRVGDNTIIGYNTTILAHEYLLHEWRTGPVHIGENVTIGANCTLLPGIVIGAGAVISAMSLVNKDVPAGAVVGGVPIRPIQRSLVSTDDERTLGG